MIEGTTKDQYARQTAPPAKNHRHHLTKMGTQNAITWDSQGKWARKCALSSAVRINFRSECWKIARVMANLYRKKEPQTLLLLSTISELNAGLLVRYWAKRCSQNGEKTLLGHCIWCFERPFCSAFWKKKCCKQMLLPLRSEVLIAHFTQVLCPAEIKPGSEVGSMQKYFECQNALQNGLQTAAVTVYVEHWTAVRGAFWGNNAANSSCWRFKVKSYSITSCKSSVQLNTNRGPK